MSHKKRDTILLSVVEFTSADDRRHLEVFMRCSATLGYRADYIYYIHGCSRWWQLPVMLENSFWSALM